MMGYRPITKTLVRKPDGTVLGLNPPLKLSPEDRKKLTNTELADLHRAENQWCWYVEHKHDPVAMAKLHEAHRQEFVNRPEPDDFNRPPQKPVDRREEARAANEENLARVEAKKEEKAAVRAEPVLCDWCFEEIPKNKGRQRKMHAACQEEKKENDRLLKEEKNDATS